MDRKQEFVLRAIEERDIRFVRLWFTDVVGTLKSIALAPAEVEAAFEPGRLLAANAGVLLSRVIQVNERSDGRRFLVLDAAMNDLMRPALYDAFHDIVPVRPRPGAAYNLTDDEPAPADVVVQWAAERLGLPRPPEVDWMDDSVGPGMRRFYLDSKRVSNARAKAELDWRPAYSSWREGLEAILASDPGER